jgi:hypothetical protein
MPETHLPCVQFSDGELAFFRRFILEPSVSRNGILRTAVESWGFCSRHTLGLLVVAACIPRSGLNTTAVLYQRVVGNAITFLGRFESMGEGSSKTLRNDEPCPMCELGLNVESPGVIRREWLTMPRSLERLRSILDDTRTQWSGFVCRACVNSETGPMCRRHAAAILEGGDNIAVNRTLDEQRSLLNALYSRLERYVQTFDPESLGVDGGEGMVALIAAAGWCARWRTLSLALSDPLDGSASDPG